MDKLVNWITVRVCDGENFDDDKIAVVKYGIELMLLKIIFFGVCLVIGAFMGMFLSALFILCFLPYCVQTPRGIMRIPGFGALYSQCSQ